MKPFTVSVTLKPPNNQSLLWRPQCDVDAGEFLGFFEGCVFVVGLDRVGDTAESEVTRFGPEGIGIGRVVIGVV